MGKLKQSVVGISVLLLMGSCSALVPAAPATNIKASTPGCQVDAEAVCRRGYALWRELTPLSAQNYASDTFWGGWNWSTEVRMAQGGVLTVNCSANFSVPATIGSDLASVTQLSRSDIKYMRRNGFCRESGAPTVPVVGTQTPVGACEIDSASLCQRFYTSCWDRSLLIRANQVTNRRSPMLWYWSNNLRLPAGGEIGLVCSAATVKPLYIAGTARLASAISTADLDYLQSHGLCRVSQQVEAFGSVTKEPLSTIACDQYLPELMSDLLYDFYIP